MKDLRTIILAAGKGTRMKSSVPKVLHPVSGKPIIHYVLDIAQAVGSLKNYVVLGHKLKEVEEHLPKEAVVVEQKNLLGTADAVKTVESRLGDHNGHILIMCGDTPLLNKSVIRELVRKHKKTEAACTFLTAVVHDPEGYGRIIRGEGGDAIAIREEKDAAGFEKSIAEINVGVYCFKCKDLFQGLKEIQVNTKKKEFYLTDIIELFYDKDIKVATVETENPEEGLGVNSREDLAAAESIMRKRILKKIMEQGVTIIDPSTTYVDADVKIGQDSVIYPCSYIEKNVKIGSRCSVGPFARLRSGTKLDDDVTIGNFTEVSRTKIGSKTLVKHFGYLGDAVIGKGVNIGAGTVVANYDGVNKNITKISDQAFIGSDSVLIAPTKVGKNAVVGAGSVVTRGTNIADNTVVAGVPAKRISQKGL
ncbi:MAG: bifunctional UDP-N-acetylglucosamine pyrophosphorylase/glucosamine-1-phosphate N-acetyltransferase [Candidatus Omnitrophota bacterium]|jgi:bifunctional UDP-N-acetylglucosamine pyrophosphorylase/glucosamine-1-phosphate N-acetyltransferase